MVIYAPSNDSQIVYQYLLKAMSHPGQGIEVQTAFDKINGHGLLYQVAGCLIDHEVTFTVRDKRMDALQREIADRTGALPADWKDADFIIVDGGNSHGQIAEAKRGSLEYPDRGATIIYEIAGAAAEDSGIDTKASVQLSGPGIQSSRSPEMVGLAIEEYRLLRDINREYPMGVDAFVIKGNQFIMGLPRSTRIEVD